MNEFLRRAGLPGASHYVIPGRPTPDDPFKCPVFDPGEFIIGSFFKTESTVQKVDFVVKQSNFKVLEALTQIKILRAKDLHPSLISEN